MVSCLCPHGFGKLTSYQTSPTLYIRKLSYPSVSDFNKSLPTLSTLESPKFSNILLLCTLPNRWARLSYISIQLMSLQVLTGCFLPDTFCLDLPDSVVGPQFLMKLVRLSSISNSRASALRAKAPCPRPLPALKLGAIWRGSLVYLEFPRTQHLDRNRAGAMKMGIFAPCQPGD